jgi:hypothetical protein
MLGVGLGINALSSAFNGSSPGGDWPLILDFENGSYTSANASYALGDVLASDTDWGNGGDLGILVPGTGLVDDTLASHSFHFSDTFVELVQAGPIVVVDFSVSGNPNCGLYCVTYEMVEWSENEIQLTNNPGGVEVGNWVKDNDATTSALTGLSNGDHKIAMLFARNRLAISVDGATVVGLTDPAHSTELWTRFMLELRNVDGACIVRSATFRDPAEGEAALPTLSAL